jgi:hypothetical protein
MRNALKRLILIAALGASPALAGDFSEGSQAKSWGLLGEELARFEGTVIDALCVLTGDCPSDCGAGARQMGILRLADDQFVLATKNTQPAFTGANIDLAPYCGQTVEADGLLVGDSDVTPGLAGAKLLQVQTLRLLDEETVHKANLWTRDWDARNPDAGGEGPWFRRDPAVAAQIEAHGRLGLGAEADEQYIKDNF